MGLKQWLFGKEAETYSPLIINDDVKVALEKIKKIEEQFKGEVDVSKKIKFPSELGEEHPFDFVMCENLYKKMGFITAVVDKYVDFVVGPGFYVECDDEKAKKIIEDFMIDVNFDTILRSWCKEGLIKGNGFLELGGSMEGGIEGMKILNANYMYVNRDKFGVVEGYNQYRGAFNKFDKNQITPFEPFEIAHFPFNKVGDCGYGQGIIISALNTINNLLKNEKDMHTLMSRKANSPYHIKLGGIVGGKYYKPNPSDVAKIGQDLQYQTNKLEWTTDGLTDIKVIDFGNIGEKFDAVLNYDRDMLFYTFQIPAVIMGMANVPEGLAVVQMDAFERRIQSIQAEMERVIEGQIFKRVLNANGFDVHVEFQWGEPSDRQKMERLLKLKELMGNLRVSESLFKLMEKDVVKLLDYDKNEYEMMSKEEERRREEERSQPIVPGQNENKPPFPVSKEKLKEENINEFIKKQGSEWCVFSHQTGKNFGCYSSEEQAKKRLAQIHAFSSYDEEIDEYTPPESGEAPQGVKDILARVYADLRSGGMKDKTKASKIAWGAVHKAGWRKINGKWVKRKESYETKEICPHCNESWENINDVQEWLGFNYREYLKSISAFIKEDDFYNLKAENDIEEAAGYLSPAQINELKRVLNKDLVQGKGIREIARDIDLKVKPSDLFEITDNKLGNLIRSGDIRSLGIARTEISRVSNEGAIKQFADNGITKICWVASSGDRTCPDCEALNGVIFETFNHPDIPLHPYCRCTTVAVPELS